MNIFRTPGKGVLINSCLSVHPSVSHYICRASFLQNILVSFLSEFLHSDKNLKSCKNGFSIKIICPKIGKNGPVRPKLIFLEFKISSLRFIVSSLTWKALRCSVLPVQALYLEKLLSSNQILSFFDLNIQERNTPISLIFCMEIFTNGSFFFIDLIHTMSSYIPKYLLYK